MSSPIIRNILLVLNLVNLVHVGVMRNEQDWHQ
jgi:hypothetical protein